MDETKVIAHTTWIVDGKRVVLNLHEDGTYSYYDYYTGNIVRGTYHEILNKLGLEVK